MSEQVGGQIYKLLQQVMQDLCGEGGIGKDRTNAQQRYNFRGIDDVLNHCGPLFAKYGIVPVPKMRLHSDVSERITLNESKERVDRYCTLELHLTLFAPDGSSVTMETLGSGLDYGGDKHVNKAMSAAFKYALFFGLAIPVDAESIADGDADAKEAERPKQQPRGTTTSEPDWIKQVDTLLIGIGCTNKEQASDVLTFATGGEYDMPEKYRASQKDAEIVYGKLKQAKKEAGDVNLLQYARTQLENTRTVEV